jgi:hypothetical protein
MVYVALDESLFPVEKRSFQVFQQYSFVGMWTHSLSPVDHSVLSIDQGSLVLNNSAKTLMP